MSRDVLFRYFFLGVLIFLIYQLLLILSPFFTGILGAVVLAILFFPLHRGLLKRISPRRHNLVAVMTTTLVVAFIILPFIFLTQLLFNEIAAFYPIVKAMAQDWQNWQSGGGSVDWLAQIKSRLPPVVLSHTAEIKELLARGSVQIFSRAVEIGKELPSYALRLILNVSVMIFTLFFLFRDGPALFSRFKTLIPMDEKYKDQLAQQIDVTLTAVVRGIFLVAIAQGVLAGIGFAIVGVPSAIVLGFVTAIAALIPLVGAAIVWVPLTLYYLYMGMMGKAVFLFLWGSLCVSMIDNLLRIVIIGGGARLPVFFLFFGLLGGVKMYGAKGLFLGPLVIALLMAATRIYREIYAIDVDKK